MTKSKKFLKNNYNLFYKAFFDQDDYKKKQKINLLEAIQNIYKSIVFILVFLFICLCPTLVFFLGVKSTSELVLFTLATIIGVLFFLLFFFAIDFFDFKRPISFCYKLENEETHEFKKLKIGNIIYIPKFFCIFIAFMVTLCFYWSTMNLMAWNNYALHLNTNTVVFNILNYVFITVLFFENISLVKKTIKKYLEIKEKNNSFLENNKLVEENLFKNMKIINNRYAINEKLGVRSKTNFFWYPFKDDEIELCSEMNGKILEFYQNLWEEFLKFCLNYKENIIFFDSKKIKKFEFIYKSIFVNFFDK